MTEESGQKPQETQESSENVARFSSIYDTPEYKKLYAESLSRKEKLQEFEKQESEREVQQKLDEGKLQEVINDLQNQIAELSPKAEGYDKANEKLTAIQDATLLEILGDFPEDQRENYKDVKDINLLRQIRSDFLKKPNVKVDGSSPGGEAAQGYDSPQAAAEAFRRKEIDETAFNKILGYFREKANR